MVIGRLKEAKVHSPGQVTVGNDTLGWHPFRMVRPEPKVADQREARGKSKPYSNTLTISFFYFCSYRAKGHAVYSPRVLLLRRFTLGYEQIGLSGRPNQNVYKD